MRALRLHGPRDLQMHDEPVPEPGPGDVRIRIKSVGICASDLHYYRDGRISSTVITEPLVIGHEASGVVDAVGERVTDLAPGDRVAIEPAKPCMKCEFCLSGNYNVCPGIPFFGTPPTDGCLRDYVTWPASLALKIPHQPKRLSFDEIAMLEPLAIGVHAVWLAGLEPSAGCDPVRMDCVAILGAGAVGLSVLQSLRAVGVSRVLVSDPVAERRKLALRLGADEVIDTSAVKPEDEIERLTGGHGVDIVFECAGEDDALRQACRAARVLGKVIVLGIPDGDDYTFDASSARRKQLSAVFVRRSNNTAERSIGLAVEGKVDLACLATHRFPLERTAEAMEFAIAKRDGVIRAIVAVSE